MDDERERLRSDLAKLRGQAQWMESTIIEIIISEAQNEVRDFKKWGFDIIPHRVVMKTGFRDADGKRWTWRTPSRTRSIRSASRSSAPCG